MNNMNIVNLTPHALNIVLASGDVLSVPASGTVARCAASAVAVGSVNGGIVLSRTSYGAVEGLPAPAEGVLYVVSGLVRAAVPDRADVASPGDLVRDSAGVVVGCRGLVVN